MISSTSIGINSLSKECEYKKSTTTLLFEHEHTRTCLALLEFVFGKAPPIRIHSRNISKI